MKPYNENILVKVLALKGAVVFLIFTIAAVQRYPSYSFWNNYLSDLGARNPSAPYFNIGVILTGILTTSLFLVLHTRTMGTSKTISAKLAPVMGAIAGIGLAGVGIFPSTMPPEHLLAALAFFAFMGIAILLFSNIYRKEGKWTIAMTGLGTFLVNVLLISLNHTDYGPGLQKITVGLMILFVLILVFNLPKPFTPSQHLEG